MKQRLLAGSVAALIGLTLIPAASAQTPKTDNNPANCSAKEYKLLKKGMSKAKVDDILDGHGMLNGGGPGGLKIYLYGTPGKSSCSVQFKHQVLQDEWR